MGSAHRDGTWVNDGVMFRTEADGAILDANRGVHRTLCNIAARIMLKLRS